LRNLVDYCAATDPAVCCSRIPINGRSELSDVCKVLGYAAL
jgi:hypothetical protein